MSLPSRCRFSYVPTFQNSFVRPGRQPLHFTHRHPTSVRYTASYMLSRTLLTTFRAVATTPTRRLRHAAQHRTRRAPCVPVSFRLHISCSPSKPGSVCCEQETVEPLGKELGTCRLDSIGCETQRISRKLLVAIIAPMSIFPCISIVMARPFSSDITTHIIARSLLRGSAVSKPIWKPTSLALASKLRCKR